MSQNAWYPPGSAQANAITANQGAPNAGGALAWPVTAAALPLPSGAATALKQDTGNTSLGSIDTKLSSQATASKQDTGNTSLASIDSKLTSPLTVTGPLTDAQLRASAVPISASALPLPSGAATEATLSTLNGKVTACNTGAVVISSSALPSGAATEGTLSTLNGKVTACNTGAVVISSGTVTAKAGTPVAGTVTQAAVTVGTSAVRCTVAGSAPSATRSILIVQPDPASTATFYLGSSSVANSGASRGISVAPGEKIYFNNDAGDYYIISGTAAQTVFITEQA